MKTINNGKDTFIMRGKWVRALANVTPEERLKVYDDIFNYAFNGELPERTYPIFELIKEDINSDNERYDNICERNKANGFKGGRPKKTETEETQNNPTVIEKPSGFSENPKKPIINNNNININKSSSLLLSQNDNDNNNFLKYLFFEKRFFNPTEELNRFINYYDRLNWKDGKGRKIENKFAALKGWKNKDAKLVPSDFSKKWRKIYDFVSEKTGASADVLITDLFDEKETTDTLVIHCGQKLLDFMSKSEEFSYMYDKMFPEKELEYLKR